MRLIENWKQAPRMYSMWAALAVVTVGGFGSYLTPEMLAATVPFLPDWTWQKMLSSVTAFLGVTGLIGRLIAQDLPAPKESK